MSAEKLNYPLRTPEWGKCIIDHLNDVRGDFASLKNKFDDIKKTVNDNTNTKIDELKTDIAAIKTTAEDALSLARKNEETLKNLQSSMQTKIEFLTSTCDDLLDDNVKLVKKTNDLENQSRRNNIVIKGIAENLNEQKSDCENLARSFFKDHLKLDATKVDTMNIVRCHRLGPIPTDKNNRKLKNFKRPIIVRFSNFHDKRSVWSARKNIADKKVHICENFCANTEYRRKKLYPIFSKAKKMANYQSKVSLSVDSLIINSKSYTCDNLVDLPDDLAPRQFAEKNNNEMIVFGGIFSNFTPFSNWYECNVPYKGHIFRSTEQAYQFAKSEFCGDAVSSLKIIHATDPNSAKKLGSKVKGFIDADWEEVKLDIMYEIVKIKFSENPELKAELLKTSNMSFAESGIDNCYATGLSFTSPEVYNSSKWIGKNKLGEMLSQIRQEIKNF